MRDIAIIMVSELSGEIKEVLKKELPGCRVFSTLSYPDAEHIDSIDAFLAASFACYEAFIFVGAMGICVRSIAPYIKDKKTDPAVVCMDGCGKYVVSVLSGHLGGANDLTRQLAMSLNAEAVVTTLSDVKGLWALDTLGQQMACTTEVSGGTMNEAIAHFVKERPTALLLDVKNEHTRRLEQECPAHVKCFYSWASIPQTDYPLILSVSPFIHTTSNMMVHYIPRVVMMGMGCQKACETIGAKEYIKNALTENGIHPLSLSQIGTIEIKKEEPLIHSMVEELTVAPLKVFTADELKPIEVPNPSQKAFEVTGLYGVSESVAIALADGGPLIVEKQKIRLSDGNNFTFACALKRQDMRLGHIEIIGAGPGDPELISVRGKRMLQEADLILYAGSLVPIELTYYAKPSAVVRSSATMNLEKQFELMKAFYDKGLFIVRLHTGDPCIYGAIQEQMNYFDQHDMVYHITPGISSFLAAAAALESQFTIPEKVQTIILTRGEGRTPMPEKEKLSLLARSQSTMCIFLSASVVDDVQQQLLEHYPPHTPVAACYHLTWKDEAIYRGELKDLAQIVKEHGLTLTTMIVVGEAIDNRKGLSRLYADEFKHLYRK